MLHGDIPVARQVADRDRPDAHRGADPRGDGVTVLVEQPDHSPADGAAAEQADRDRLDGGLVTHGAGV